MSQATVDTDAEDWEDDWEEEPYREPTLAEEVDDLVEHGESLERALRRLGMTRPTYHKACNRARDRENAERALRRGTLEP